MEVDNDNPHYDQIQQLREADGKFDRDYMLIEEHQIDDSQQSENGDSKKKTTYLELVPIKRNVLLNIMTKNAKYIVGLLCEYKASTIIDESDIEDPSKLFSFDSPAVKVRFMFEFRRWLIDRDIDLDQYVRYDLTFTPDEHVYWECLLEKREFTRDVLFTTFRHVNTYEINDVVNNIVMVRNRK